MGLRGPLPVPDLHAINGGADHRPAKLPKKEPPYRPIEPKWADIFGKDAKARKDAAAEWALTVAELDRRGTITRTDASTVVDYCICHARVLQCERELSAGGFVVEGANGPVKNPVSTILNQYRGNLQTFRTALGLSPAGRVRLGQQEEAPPDDDSDLDEPG
jgi:P27 family predicted phage terminase small subunit